MARACLAQAARTLRSPVPRAARAQNHRALAKPPFRYVDIPLSPTDAPGQSPQYSPVQRELHRAMLERAAGLAGGPEPLAKRLGVSPTIVRALMNGRGAVPISLFVRLADLISEADSPAALPQEPEMGSDPFADPTGSRPVG
ncbi:MAG: hypothetical protein ACREUH_04770 [Burkholderiales bacterium]